MSGYGNPRSYTDKEVEKKTREVIIYELDSVLLIPVMPCYIDFRVRPEWKMTTRKPMAEQDGTGDLLYGLGRGRT